MTTNQTKASEQAMTDKDMCYDILQFQKYALQNYTVMIMEIADTKIRNLALKHQQELYADQYDMWKAMYDLGYYKTKPAAPADVIAGITEAKTMSNQLSCN